MLCLLLFPLPEGKQRQSINYSVFYSGDFRVRHCGATGLECFESLIATSSVSYTVGYNLSPVFGPHLFTFWQTGTIKSTWNYLIAVPVSFHWMTWKLKHVTLRQALTFRVTTLMGWTHIVSRLGQ